MKFITKLSKWLTVLVLILPTALFFTPYSIVYDKSYSGYDMAIEIFKVRELTDGTIWNNTLLEMILRYIVPLVLMLLAGIIFMIRANIVTGVIAVIFSIISTNIYRAAIDFLDEDKVGIGLKFSFILAIVGIILPIVTVVLRKISKSRESENKANIEKQEGEEV